MSKQKLIAQIARDMFKEKGYKKTSCRSIAKKANVSISMIFYYYGTKENMYKALFPDVSLQNPVSKKEQIVKAATELFADSGYARVSIRDIAEKADVNSAAISYYFGGKDGLYREILERGSSLLVDFVQEAVAGAHEPMEVLAMYSQFFYKLVKEHPYIVKIFSWELIHPTEVFISLGQERFSMVFIVLRSAIQQGMDEGCFRQDLKPTEVCISWAGMVAYFYLMSAIKKRFDLKEDVSEGNYIKQAFDVFIHGIAC